jgi:hypothetical protein
LEHFGAYVVRAVLVADDRDERHTVIGNHAAFVVLLTEESVEAFFRPLSERRRMSDPYGGSEHEDVGVEDALTDFGPVVADAFVAADTGLDVQIRESDRSVHGDVLCAQLPDQLAEQAVGRRRPQVEGFNVQSSTTTVRSAMHRGYPNLPMAQPHPPRQSKWPQSSLRASARTEARHLRAALVEERSGAGPHNTRDKPEARSPDHGLQRAHDVQLLPQLLGMTSGRGQRHAQLAGGIRR